MIMIMMVRISINRKMMNLFFLFSVITWFILIPSSFINADHTSNIDKNTTNNNTNNDTSFHNKGRGIIMCSGKRHIRYAKRNIYLIRHVWKSSLPFVIIHCNELTREDEGHIQLFDAQVRFLDVCSKSEVMLSSIVHEYSRSQDSNTNHENDNETTEITHQKFFDLPEPTLKKLLRGFYCKIAGLLVSPFEETLLMDMDTIWFQSPDILFDFPSFQLTGAYFMRARMLLHTKKSALNPEVLMEHFKQEGVGVDAISAQKQLVNHGYNLFWQHYAYPSMYSTPRKLSDVQDSCVVLVNKRKHPKFLGVLLRYLRTNFVMGYGDKELFWIAATVSGEPFTFEPYITGQYRDCHGVNVHFDPREINPNKTIPLVMNGEFLVERGSEKMLGDYTHEVNWVGEYLQDELTLPILASPNISLFDMQTWKLKDLNGKGCSCFDPVSGTGAVACGPPTVQFTQQLLLAQWLTYTASLNPPNPTSTQCIPVLISYADLLSKVLQDNVLQSWCSFVGCPILPVELVNVTMPWMTKQNPGQFCDPIAFYNGIENRPEALVISAQFARSRDGVYSHNHPNIPVNHTIGCPAYGRKIYLLKEDGKLHRFPGFKTFAGLGFDFADTHYLKPWQFDSFEIGDDLPAL